MAKPNVLKLSSPTTQEFWEIPVLLEDEHLLALSKPAGLFSAPDAFTGESPTLLKLLHGGIAAGKPWAVERKLDFLLNANRLDPETTGIILFAKSKDVHSKLLDLMGTDKVVREWLVLVQGIPEQSQFEITARIAPDQNRPERMRIDAGRGKRAQTACAVQETFSEFTLLQCNLGTDRNHQVRLHLRWVGLPVVGDSVYGGRPLLLSRLKRDFRLKEGHTERPLMARPAIHAAKFTFPHPVSGEPITLSDPEPKDLQVALKYLRRYALPRG
jgi:RluA family pseudouridine synthase